MSKKLWELLEKDYEIRAEFGNCCTAINPGNNCWSWATGNNFHFDSAVRTPAPGEWTIIDYSVKETSSPVKYMRNALVAEGLKFIGWDKKPPMLPDNMDLIAAFVSETRPDKKLGGDFHFIRLHQDGIWDMRNGNGRTPKDTKLKFIGQIENVNQPGEKIKNYVDLSEKANTFHNEFSGWWAVPLSGGGIALDDAIAFINSKDPWFITTLYFGEQYYKKIIQYNTAKQKIINSPGNIVLALSAFSDIYHEMANTTYDIELKNGKSTSVDSEKIRSKYCDIIIKEKINAILHGKIY